MINRVKIFNCKRCGWEWASRKERPVICPKCKTPYWDKERKIKDEKDEK
jgi:predicted Zn-ribbon and HTH transcriptional regulator